MKKRYLLLWRHAKSSWDNKHLSDFDRPLNQRGKKAAVLMGRYMFDNRLLPDKVLCSPSRRTRDTLTGLQPHLPHGVRIEFLNELYHSADYKSAIAAHAGQSQRLMVIAHNETLHTLAIDFTWDATSKEAKALREKFPTAALVIISWETERFLQSPGTLEAFIRPRDLLD